MRLSLSLLAVVAGGRVVERFDRPVRRRQEPPGWSTLSGRERTVLRLLVEGSSTQRIADQLGVSVQTVRSHVQGVLRKLGVGSRTKAARVAAEYQSQLSAERNGRAPW